MCEGRPMYTIMHLLQFPLSLSPLSLCNALSGSWDGDNYYGRYPL